jgi:hypothetical protein
VINLTILNILALFLKPLQVMDLAGLSLLFSEELVVVSIQKQLMLEQILSVKFKVAYLKIVLRTQQQLLIMLEIMSVMLLA